jgi:hypothetical protein
MKLKPVSIIVILTLKPVSIIVILTLKSVSIIVILTLKPVSIIVILTLKPVSIIVILTLKPVVIIVLKLKLVVITVILTLKPLVIIVLKLKLMVITVILTLNLFTAGRMGRIAREYFKQAAVSTQRLTRSKSTPTRRSLLATSALKCSEVATYSWPSYVRVPHQCSSTAKNVINLKPYVRIHFLVGMTV